MAGKEMDKFVPLSLDLAMMSYQFTVAGPAESIGRGTNPSWREGAAVQTWNMLLEEPIDQLTEILLGVSREWRIEDCSRSIEIWEEKSRRQGGMDISNDGAARLSDIRHSSKR